MLIGDWREDVRSPDLASARRKARVDRGEDVIVDVNKYRTTSQDVPELLEVDNTRVRDQQVTRLKTIRNTRDKAAAEQAIQNLEKGAAGSANLLELCVQAARARVTVGETSSAMEKVFTRTQATTRSKIGSASGRDRMCQYRKLSVVAL